MSLRSGEPDANDFVLGGRRLVSGQLGTHSPLAFSASEAVQHLVEREVVGIRKSADLVTHRLRDPNGSR